MRLLSQEGQITVPPQTWEPFFFFFTVVCTEQSRLDVSLFQ